jgi:hypothetical protein
MSEDRIGWAVTVVVVVVLTVAILGGVLSYTWGMPNAVECVDEPTAERTPAMGVEVTANRARGYIMERNVLGCTVFFYQTRGDGDSYH